MCRYAESEYGSESEGESDAENAEYRSPTIKLLNPELYLLNIKDTSLIRDHNFETSKHIRERYDTY
jgi:hypothetical protein